MKSDMPAYVAEPYQFAPEEKPGFPGSPHTPKHEARNRLYYTLIAIVTGIVATLGNALVTVNVSTIAGELGLDVAEASWFSPTYVAMNACANLLLVKARIQFGIPAVTRTLLISYALAGALQLIFPTYSAALLIRAVSGMTAAGLVTMTIYNLLQVFSIKDRPLALVIGISISQLGQPLARLFPIEMLALNHWQGLHLMEISLALTALTAITALPLPPSIKAKAFEKLDFVTIALFMPAIILFCGVLGLGRIMWWTDTPWIGAMLAAAIPLFTTAILIERHRKNPLLQIDWVSSRDILRFAAVALLVRMALAEQSYGAVGLLSIGGLNNDQFHILFALVAVSIVLGIVAASLTLSVSHLPYQVMTAALIIAFGAWLDTDATNLTRPPELYLSQALIGFGTALFIGPALVYGFIRLMQKGAPFFVSFVVLFSITQNVGSLVGSALLGTYQTVSARAHAAALSEHLVAANPQIAERLARGPASLYSALTGEASILAYNDVFFLVMCLSLATALFVAFNIVLTKIRQRRPAMIGVPA